MKHHSLQLTSASGIVVLCDRQGLIARVVHDGLGLASRLPAGRPFDQAISAGQDQEPRAEAVAARFMDALRTSGYAFGWEIQVPVKGHLTNLSFTGGATNDGVLIVGDAVHSDATRLVEELMRINNETVNFLRAAAKQAALSTEAKNEQDNGLLAELSSAHNEVMTAQRELAKANATLRQTNADLVAMRSTLEARQRALEEANLRLDQLATVDGLTGVKNRRAFGERLGEEIIRSLRYQIPLSLLLLDVDKFKQYNDTFGHLGGDDVLRSVARLLCEQVRTSDFVARYGGEEFTVVLSNTDAGGSLIMAERLRNSIEKAIWTDRAVTASFGAATLSLEDNTDTALIGAADRALYSSKENGRNRVTHCHSMADPFREPLAEASEQC